MLYQLENGETWERQGECSHCGWCCQDCEFHDTLLMRCKDYGGDKYRGFGCPTWPDVSFRDKLPDSCTYTFVRV